MLAIPGRLNVALALIAVAVAGALLRFVAHADALALRLVGALAFSYVNNTIFSLLHEAVHGVFHGDERWNAMFGRWLAAFFPTSFTLQRFFHLGHHRRNRTEAERFDYIAPGESALLKRVQWYGILTGLYWLLPPLSCLAYLVAPRAFATRFVREEEWSRQSGAEAMVEGLERVPRGVARAEIAFAIAWQCALFVVLDLNWQAWALCYGAFAINWSSLQYADHAWSPLDRVEGAWNLRVNRVVQWLFLNYHHHKAHHANPKVSWIHLPRFVDFAERRPSFLRVYLQMWRGPRPLPGDAR
ncbi:MAG TPA: fatty acid desaturase [Thermoanaerobaculia bacterium]|nr:fatty acid desaturase [Thermoanaerobaculia bacterium]